MKIQSLRFKNLNALVGQWHIDFTHPEYQSEGIFAITGPTGAGKSTLLDALCLALYGRTPRLERINQSTNEIMSRHQAACFAEVVFETTAGQFSCHWSQHRARRDPQGALQPPKHELANDNTGKIIQTGLRAVAEAVDKITGLNYERFTRSMLLAQGGFAAFLQADSNERAPLLEQITGTEIYAEISIKVHEQLRIQTQALDALKEQLDAIDVLDEESLAFIKNKITQQEEKHKALTQAIEANRRSIQWREQIEQLKQHLEKINIKKEELNKKQIDFAEQKNRFQWAKKARQFEQDYVRIESLEEQIRPDEVQVKRLIKEIPETKALYKEAKKAQQQLSKAIQKHQAFYEIQSPIWQQVIHLDQQIKQKQNELNAQQQKMAQRQQEMIRSQEKKNDVLSKEKKAGQSLEKKQMYLVQNQTDEQLVGGLEGFLVSLQHWQGLKNELKAYQCQYKKKQEEALALHENLLAVKKKKGNLNQQLQQYTVREDQLKTALNTLLEGQSLQLWTQRYASAQEQLLLRRTIANLETQRNHLQAGEPCPLCGATEHPYLAGHIPKLSTYEEEKEKLEKKIQKAEQLNNELAQQALLIQNKKEKFYHAKQRLTQEENKVQLVNQSMQNLDSQMNKIKKQVQRTTTQLERQLQPLSLRLRQFKNIESITHVLKQRRQQWLDSQNQVAELRQHQFYLQAEAKRWESILMGQQKEYAHEKEQHHTVVQQHAQLREKRESLFGDDCPELALQQWQSKKKQLENQLKGKEQKRLQFERRYVLLEGEERQLTQRLEKNKTQLKGMIKAFVQKIQQAGFVDRADFDKRRLPESDYAELVRQAEYLQQEKIRLAAMENERRQLLNVELKRNLSSQSFAELKNEQQALTQSIEEVEAKRIRYQQQIDLDKHHRAQQAAQFKKIKKQQKERERWQNLHELIGSADGKKYRNFVQGLSFAQLVYYANQQLRSMSDRYILVPDKLEGLSLNVLDNYQGGIERSTQNLSGGESFLVSLALALGLSKMASQNVRIDSLFLDEGFGTLDDQALEMALDTLANLRQENKLIGVISHVPAIKERIHTQIQVITNQQGVSRLLGPGCTQQ